MVVCTMLPINPLLPRCPAAAPRRPIVLQTDQQLVETPTSLSDSPPCSSITFLPIGEIEFNGKPVSKCVPLSRPTRVLSVIPVTGAPILHGKATTTTHHHSLDSHRKSPTPSPNQLTYWPPGQKTVLEEYIGYQLSDFGSVMFTSPSHVCFPRFAISMP